MESLGLKLLSYRLVLFTLSHEGMGITVGHGEMRWVVSEEKPPGWMCLETALAQMGSSTEGWSNLRVVWDSPHPESWDSLLRRAYLGASPPGSRTGNSKPQSSTFHPTNFLT